MEQLSATPQDFHEYIPLNEKMTPEEAIKKLAYYHNSNADQILKVFINLRNFIGTVEFKKSVNSGHECIVMEGKNPNGNFSWNHLIDIDTGQPEFRCG